MKAMASLACTGSDRVRASLLALLLAIPTSSASSQSTLSSAGSAARLLWADKLQRANDGNVAQVRDVSLSLHAGQRLGLVGSNGCGKSTLLKTLALVERPDAGTVERARGARILYSDQDPPLVGRTIREAVYLGSEPDTSSTADQALRAAFAYHRAVADASLDLATVEEAAAAASASWEADARAVAVCDVLGLTALLDRDVAECSGGERKRAGLASVLARDPDALLLDEPTNHLDGRAVEWLIELLTRPASNRALPAVLCVSHDRYFLEAVCRDGLLELDRGALHFYNWQASYAAFLNLKEERLQAAQNVADRAETLLRREREWMMRQPKARESKSRAREQRFHELEEAAAAAGPAGGADLMGLGAKMQRLGNKVLRLDSATIGCGDAATAPIREFSFEFAPGMRLGVLGANGCGKTTLLSAIVGELPLIAGERVVGETVRFGHYDQRGLEADALTGDDSTHGLGSGREVAAEMRVLAFVQRCVEDAVADVGEAALLAGSGTPEAAARRLLSLLAFPRDKWGTLVGRLSGGERRRLQLLAVLARSPNVLMLDEPTNDLDLPTIAALEQFLHDEFGGVLLCVSHDRAFIERTCTDGCLAFVGNGRVEFMPGGYAQYLNAMRTLEERKRDQADAARRAKAPQATGAHGDSRDGPKCTKLSFKEAKELDGIEAEVAALRDDLARAEAAVEEACAADSGDYGLVADLSAAAAELAAKVDAREERWLELMERLAEIPG